MENNEEIATKVCSKCNKSLPLSDFTWRNDNQKYRNECRTCFNSGSMKRHYKRNKERIDKRNEYIKIITNEKSKIIKHFEPVQAVFNFYDSPENEEWRDIVGWEGYFQVSCWGRVKSLDRIVPGRWGTYTVTGKIMSPCVLPNGYLLVCFKKYNKGHNKHVHRLVIETFHGVPYDENLQTNHKNGFKRDSRPSNLEWTTAKENAEHAHRMGLSKSKRGELSHRSKLTKEDVLKIRASYGSGELNSAELSKLYNVRQSAIMNIIHRKSWKDI